MTMLSRRAALIVLATGCLPPVAVSAQRDKPVHLAILSMTSGLDSVPMRTLKRRLEELGYIEGRTLTLDFRGADGRIDQLPDLAARLVARRPAIVLAFGGAEPVFAARNATSAIPIVFTIATDPVADGLVASLARPGGNVTGVSSLNAELDGKRLELIKEVLPAIKRVAVLVNATDRTAAAARKRAETAAQRLGLQLEGVDIRAPVEIDAAIERARASAEAALLLGTPFFYPHLQRVGALAVKHRLPLMAPWRELPAAGGLMSYGTHVAEMFRRAADMADRILKGARPADMPIEQPTTFELVINAKAAEALGITLNPALLTRADTVLR
jgi:putative tryptophan/tyrosine transport system substrate-binding protein